MFAQSRSKITFVCLHLPNFQLFSETIVNEGSKDQQAKPLEELKCNLKCFELFICVKGSGRNFSWVYCSRGCRPNDFQKERWWEKTKHLWTCTSQMSSHFSVWEATRSNRFLRPTKKKLFNEGLLGDRNRFKSIETPCPWTWWPGYGMDMVCCGMATQETYIFRVF